MNQNADKPSDEVQRGSPNERPASPGPGTESERIARLKASHGSHRTAGSALPDHDPSDEDIRRKAFELWESGGCRDGRDRDDWFRAKALLEGASPAAEPAALDAPSAVMAAVAGSIQTMTTLAAGAAEAFAGMFATQDRPKDPK